MSPAQGLALPLRPRPELWPAPPKWGDGVRKVWHTESDLSACSWPTLQGAAALSVPTVSLSCRLMGPGVAVAEQGLLLWGQDHGTSGCCSHLSVQGLCFPLNAGDQALAHPRVSLGELVRRVVSVFTWDHRLPCRTHPQHGHSGRSCFRGCSQPLTTVRLCRPPP